MYVMIFRWIVLGKFMKKVALNNFLNSINFTNSEFDDFWTLGNATSLSEDTKGQKLEFYRGPLLYALICYLKPKKIFLQKADKDRNLLWFL